MKYKLLLTIFSICFIIAILLSFIPIAEICGIEVSSSCSVVQNSNYKQIMGISNSYIGIVAFLALILITISHMVKPRKEKEWILITGVVICSIFAAYFIYLQFFILNAICKYCMVVDIGSILALIIILVYSTDKKK